MSLTCTTTTILGLLAGLISGAALPNSQPSCSSTFQDANFDDITIIPGTDVTPVPTPYKGLEYQSFNVIQFVDTGASGVRPHSPPKYIVSSAQTETTAGTAMVSTNYPNAPSGVTFDINSFYFDCVLRAENPAVAPPTQCTVTVTGYTGNDNTVSGATEVCAKTFQYNPTTITGTQDQAFTGSISGCTGLTFAQFQYTLPGGLALANADLGFNIDNFDYTLHKCSS